MIRVLACLLLWCEMGRAQPLVDHHQHLFSPVLAPLVSQQPITAADLIRHLDAAGIERAAVLSTAYILAAPSRNLPNERDAVRADNDWTAAQAAQYPQRLVAFCGINPLKDYALDEIARCARDPHLRRGLKLHFGNSRVDYRDAAHLEQLRQVFRAANDHGMAIVVHMRVNTDGTIAYGREEALAFINELIAAAPDVFIQVAHLAGAGGYEYPMIEEILDVFVEAIARNDPLLKNVWFDVTGVAMPAMTTERADMIARRIRQLGIERGLFGSDAPAAAEIVPRARWDALRALPLTEAELEAIARNVAPYMR